MHPNHIIFIFWHLNELWFGLDLQAFLWCGGEQNFQHPSLVSINILVPPHRVGPNCHLYQVMQTASWMILKWEDAVCRSFGSFSADIGHDIFITHCSPFSGLTSSVLTDTFCGKKNSYLGLIRVSYLGLGKTWTCRKISFVFSIHLCENEPGFMKFVFLKKKLFNSQPMPWPSCAFQQDLQRQLDEWAPKPEGFLIETWSQTQVDGGGGKTGRNKSCIFVLLWPESQNQRWNFVVPALFCASQSFHTDGSVLRIRHFIYQGERSRVPVPAMAFLCQSILCSWRNENEKSILKPSIGRFKKKKKQKTQNLER